MSPARPWNRREAAGIGRNVRFPILSERYRCDGGGGGNRTRRRTTQPTDLETLSAGRHVAATWRQWKTKLLRRVALEPATLGLGRGKRRKK